MSDSGFPYPVRPSYAKILVSVGDEDWNLLRSQDFDFNLVVIDSGSVCPVLPPYFVTSPLEESERSFLQRALWKRELDQFALRTHENSLPLAVIMLLAGKENGCTEDSGMDSFRQNDDCMLVRRTMKANTVDEDSHL